MEQETEELYGAGNDPIDIQAGNRKYSGSLKVLKGAFEGINLAVQAVGYKDILDAPASAISIVAVYKPSGSRVLQTDTLLACKFEKYEKGMDQGDKMMEIELPFKFLSIKST